MSRKNNGDKVVVFERGGLVFAFNFHWSKSYTDYRIGVDQAGTYRVVLNSDRKEFLGHGRVDETCQHFTESGDWDGRANWMQVGCFSVGRPIFFVYLTAHPLPSSCP